MKLDFSRYAAFLSNPERFRLRYILNLVPESDDEPTLFNYGRRRGSCTHEILDAYAAGNSLEPVRAKYPAELFDRCVKLADVMPPNAGPVVISEREFDVPVFPGSRHSIIGRIDRVVMVDGVPRVEDFKTTKKRTKAEFSRYLGELSTSFQVPFYLAAAAALGYETDEFLFHVLIDEKDKPAYYPLELPPMGPAEIERRMRHVRAACIAIEALLQHPGPDYPWPHSNAWPCCGDRMQCGYGEICGRKIPKGCVPTGFKKRIEHLAQLGGADNE